MAGDILFPRFLSLILALLLLFSSVSVTAEEKPRRIKVIGMGKAESTPILKMWFTTEPSTDPLIFPASSFGRVIVIGDLTGEDVKRYMRIYFPRSYEALLEYEFCFLAQVDMSFLSPQQERWIYDALSEHERGGVNTRSIMRAHDWIHIPWRDSVVSDAFPNDVETIAAAEDPKWEGGRLVIRDDADLPSIMKPFKEPVEGLFTYYSACAADSASWRQGTQPLMTIPKPGSVILSYTQNNQKLGHPVPGQIAHIFYWRWNSSVTFTFQDMVFNTFWSPREAIRSNPYALDIITNIIWFSTGRELPDDSLKVHEFRTKMYNFNIRKGNLISLLDFAESFGANPAREYEKLNEAEEIASDASDHYLDRNFDFAYETVEVALGRIDTLEEEVADLKDRTLMWVYAVEWSVMTGAFLVAGFVLWTLMVRRALYKEVGQTRTSSF